MPTLEDHCTSIAQTIADYREGDLAAPDMDHVMRWVTQFDLADQDTIAAEIDRALKKTYVSERNIDSFLSAIVEFKALVGEAPTNFWQSTSMLEIQGVSDSQRNLVGRMKEAIRERLNVEVLSNDNDAENWLYVDDGIFSGNQAISDIKKWLETCDPRDGKLNILVIVAHTSGDYQLGKALRPLLHERNISLSVWRGKNIENRLTYSRQTDVLWPTEVYDENTILEWQELRGNDLRNFRPRADGNVGGEELFSSPAAKRVVERAFTQKGAEICSFAETHQNLMKPLGFSPFRTYGFGTIFATHRNCPNNAPLVLWWGDPVGNHTLRRWYPLLQRRVRSTDPQAFEDWDF